MTPSFDSLRLCLDRALDFLVANQKPCGEFSVDQFDNPALDGAARSDPAIFLATFVLHALRFIEDPRAVRLIESMRRFLKAEERENGIWRYRLTNDPDPLPGDLDDTCCAAFELWGRAPASGEQPPNVAIVLANRDEEGRFKTWLRPTDAHNDADAVVNANVLLYLGAREETMQAANFLIEAIEQGTEATAMHYYLDSLALYYAVSRAYHHGVVEFSRCRDTILTKTAARLEGEDMDSLSLALGFCSLINYSIRPMESHPEMLARLVAQQQSDGSWPKAAFYSGPGPPWEPQAWWGSAEMTTSFCVEAIARVIGQRNTASTGEML
jgi:hypothetical protein